MAYLPFGLDLKTAIITVLFVYLVLPYMLNFFLKATGSGRGRNKPKANNQL